MARQRKPIPVEAADGGESVAQAFARQFARALPDEVKSGGDGDKVGKALAKAFAKAVPLELQGEGAGAGADLMLRRRKAALQMGGGPPAPVAGLKGDQTGGGRGAVFGTFGERLKVSADAFGEKLQKVGDIVGTVGSGWLAAGKGIESFVAKANPGAVQRFTFALEDTQAVIGQRLAPVLEVITQGIRLFADVINTILPSGEEFAQLLQPVTDLLNDLREALAPVAAIIHDVLVVGFKLLGAALQVVIIPFRLLARLLGALFGAGEETKLKSSVGAAVRNVSFGSVEQYQQQIYRAALMGGVTTNPPTGGQVDTIIGLLGDIKGGVLGIAGKIGAKLAEPATPGGGIPEAIARKGAKGAVISEEEYKEKYKNPKIDGILEAWRQAADALEKLTGGMGTSEGGWQTQMEAWARRAVDGWAGGSH
jgi:hypothetical protein